jgi:hypothetical protein
MFLLVLLMLLGAPHVSRCVADPLGEVYRQGRGLQQQDSGPSFGGIVPAPSVFGLTPSEAISSLGSWANNPGLNFTCIGPDDQPYVVGPANPELCVEQVEVTMSSELFGNVTVVFDADQLSELRSVSPTDPTQYVWGLPLNKYAVPNAYYEGASLNVTFVDGWANKTLSGNIRNYFNASATSLREYYGVDPSLQGSNETVQGSVLYFGVRDSAVNTTAASEYLALQGLVPNVPLQITDWAPPNNVSVCVGDAASSCGETQLDVEAQQAFAPQAVTFFAPTEEMPLSYYVEAARSAGYTEDQIQQFLDKFEAEGKDSPDVQPFIDALEPAADKAYFADFVSNVTSSEERVQVVSLSWFADYTDGIGDFKVFEDALKNLTLSGITVRV